MRKRLKRGYDYTYWAIDIHDTLVPSTYTYPNVYDLMKYDYMVLAMQTLSRMPDMKIILWSCTTKEKIQELSDLLEKHDINIDYFNENPECESNDISYFQKKFYFDIGLDDKFSFNPYTDWKIIYTHVRTIQAFGIEEYLKRADADELPIMLDD